MKSILHLKEDTEYQIPLREDGTEKDNKEIIRAKAGVAPATQAKNEAEVESAEGNTEAQQNLKTSKEESEQSKAAKKETDEISPEKVNDEEEVNNENDSALDNLKEENPNQEHSNTEEGNSDTNTESVPQVDTAKAALDEMKKLASQEGVIHPSLFISNFSKILGLMERAMQLQVKESGSATEESGSVTKEEAPKATEQAETTEKTETPAEDK